MRVRKGDEVEVIAGKDRGKRGRVLRVDAAKERVFVEGLNVVKRHTRPQETTTAAGQNTAAQLGGVIEREGAIHVSNVALLDPRDHRPTRVGIEREDGRAYRVARRSGTRLD
jgi:large subunit ribosomal protein L24